MVEAGAGAGAEAEAEIEAEVVNLFVQGDDHSKMTQETLKKVQQCEQAAGNVPNVAETVLNAAHEDRAQLRGLLMGL